MSSQKKRATRLSQEHLIKLGDYLRANKSDLELTAHTFRNVAASASQLLGFPISVNSIGRVSAMVGVTIKTTSNGGTVFRRVRGKQIELLRQAVTALYEKCGEAVPESLTAGWPSNTDNKA